MHLFHKTNIDFLRWRWHAIVLSWVIIIAGVADISLHGIRKGLEFQGGTEVIAQFQSMTSIDSVRDALDKNYPGGGGDAIVQIYGDPALHRVMVRVPQVGGESGDALSQTRAAVEKALMAGNLPQFQLAGTEIVSPTVGRELTQRGLWAFFLSLGGILLYIAFRFQFSFAVGAVVATVHDVLVTLAFLAFFKYDMTLNVIAAILTVTGYSTNDTIVIFDRVRENMRAHRRESIFATINTALNQTLGRTVITAGTALLSAIALFLFGGEVLHGFAFTMIVGIITGTYSSVFVAAAIVTFWRKKGARPATTGKSTVAGGAEAAAIPPAPAASKPQSSRRSKQRKARAS